MVLVKLGTSTAPEDTGLDLHQPGTRSLDLNANPSTEVKRPRNSSALFRLLAANTVSGASQGILIISVPWYFTDIIERPGLFGIIYMMINVGSLFWGLYAGTIVDRYDRRKVFIGTCAVGSAVGLSLAALGFVQGSVPIWGAAMGFAVTIFVFNIHYPNLYAFGQEITNREHYSKITSWFEIQGQLTSAIAGAIAAILLSGLDTNAVDLGLFSIPDIHIKAWNLHDIFLLDGITYMLAISLLMSMNYEPAVRRKVDTGSIWKRLITGIDWLREHPRVFLFGSASYAIFVTILVAGFFLQAIYVKEHLQAGASMFALGDMAFALGSLAAGLMIVWVFKNWKPVNAIILLSFFAIGYFLISIFNYNPAIFLFSFLLLGLANAGTRILRMTWLFERVPNDVMGRAGGVFHTLNVMCRIVFLGLFSLPLFTGPGVIWAFAILAGFIGIGVLGLIRVRQTAS